MVGQGSNAFSGQPSGDFFGAGTGKAIDDPRLAALFPDEVEKLAPPAGLGLNAIADVWSVETAEKLPSVLQGQPLEDLLTRRGIGCRRQSDPRNLGKELRQNAQSAIFRPEVVPPLADAMSLVDGEEGEATVLEELQETVHQQPFRCHVE